MKRFALVALTLLVPLIGACRPRSEPAPAPAPAAAAATAAPAAAVVPADPTLLADLPDYPGALVLATSSKGPDDGWSRVQKRELAVAGTYAEARDFYRKAIAEHGWAVTKAEEKADECKWRLAKGSSLGEVEVEWKAKSARVEIRLERRDR